MKFTEYKKEIRELIITVNGKGKIDSEVAMRTIGFLGLRMCDVDNNEAYFKECFEKGYSPFEAIESLRYNESELIRDIEAFSDDLLIEEVNSRKLDIDIIRSADTDDLEDELDNRYDTNYVKLYQVSDSDLIDELRSRGYSSYECGASPENAIRAVICNALGLSNHFAYTIDEIIEILKEKYV